MKRERNDWGIQPRRKYENARFEKCKVCGQSWNVSKDMKLDWRGYICPRCKYKSE